MGTAGVWTVRHVARCVTLALVFVQVSGQQTQEGALRLTGGSGPWDGRLEVFFNGQWGAVCDDGFGADEAGVACWQMGYSRVAANYSTIGEDVNNPPILLDDVRCSGNEVALAQCEHRQWAHNDCKDVEHVALFCQSDPCRHSPCHNGGTCLAVDDTNFTCTCDHTHAGPLCQTDVNFCELANGGCSHLCLNLGAGSFRCACPDKLRLNADQHSCHAPSVGVMCGRDMVAVFKRAEWPGLHGQYLTTRNSSCRAAVNNTHIIITIPVHGCGTTSQAVSDGYVFENTVQTQSVAVDGVVSRVRDVHMTVRCHYQRNALLHNFYIVNTGVIHFSDMASGHYRLRMDLFHDGHQFVGQPLEQVEPGEDLSLRFSLSTNDSSLQVFARNCRATTTASDTATQYLFLDDGCAKDPSLQHNQAARDQETLQLQAFQFVADNSSYLLLHCDVVVCNVSDPSNRCSQGCLSGGRRDTGAYPQSTETTLLHRAGRVVQDDWSTGGVLITSGRAVGVHVDVRLLALSAVWGLITAFVLAPAPV